MKNNPFFESFISKITTHANIAHLGYIYFTLAIVTALTVTSKSWRLARNAITWAHELGHSVAAILAGGGVHSIRLNHDTSGVTSTALPRRKRKKTPSPLLEAFVSFWGYPAPGVIGFLLAIAIWSGYSTSALFGLLLLVFFTFLFIRNFWGLLIVLLLGGAIVTCTLFLPTRLDTYPIAFLSSFFLWGSLRSTTESVSRRRKKLLDPNNLGNDVYGVASRTALPEEGIEFLWFGTWGLCAFGTGWLVLNPGILPFHL